MTNATEARVIRAIVAYMQDEKRKCEEAMARDSRYGSAESAALWGNRSLAYGEAIIALRRMPHGVVSAALNKQEQP